MDLDKPISLSLVYKQESRYAKILKTIHLIVTSPAYKKYLQKKRARRYKKEFGDVPLGFQQSARSCAQCESLYWYGSLDICGRCAQLKRDQKHRDKVRRIKGEKGMAGKTELDAAIVALVASVNDEISKANAVITEAGIIITEGTNAISRLLAKIAAGSPDTQPEIDQLNTLQTTLATAGKALNATNDALTSATATFKVEGN